MADNPPEQNRERPMQKYAFSLVALMVLTVAAQAQTPAPAASTGETARGLAVEHLPRLPSVQTGQAPGMRVAELVPTKRYQVLFSPGDEVIQGLAEFAAKNNITIAHFTAFGALSSASLSWFNAPQRSYKTIRINEPMEVVSFEGSIVRNATTGAHTVHVHGAVARYRDGDVLAGHFIDAKIGVTMQVYVDDSTPLNSPAAPAN